MKKNILFLLFLVVLNLTHTHAQLPPPCAPDTSYTAPGIYPDSIAGSCIGQAYSQVITMIVPQDTTISQPPLPPVTVPIDSFVIRNILNLPPGITYQCNPTNCNFPGGTANCITLYGTPTTTGTYVVDMVVEGYVNMLGGVLDTLKDVYTIQITPVVSATIDSIGNVLCNGDSTGSLTILASGGTPPYEYAVDSLPFDSSNIISGLAAGVYDITVKDANGCMAMVTDTINEPSVMVSTLSGNNPSGPSTNDGSATASAVGGTPPYTFSWNTGSTMPFIFGLNYGIYTCTITDANGCTIVDSIELYYFHYYYHPWGIEDDLGAGVADVQLYPNPNNGICMLTIGFFHPEEMTISIMDMTGTAVYTQSTTATIEYSSQLQLDDLASGIYLLTIKTTKGITSRRFVVE